MISFDRAKKEVLSFDERLTHYIEYPDVYVFFNPKLKGNERMDSGIIISKSDGREISYLHWIKTRDYNINKYFFRLPRKIKK